ncbi:54S ribosomal protein L35, mitochondrial [Sparassis crispa]|uniref:54S ribosomal protein L35, mitochondrial n=1 Tax=Sparassis crispa TaxID=139825 RepID=A0A401G996_9APHY|nr:54S ribosomal protein L35, mitochondrial [Sparassis crispa]GBE78719.1 54S ribosomal protein L35, mitochondrial [Sparassis crispa]
MLALRRLPRSIVGFAGVRGNASLQSSSSAEPVTPLPPPPPQAAVPTPEPSPSPAKPAAAEASASASPKEESARGTVNQTDRKWPTRRPPISAKNPREWNRPIAKGVLPVYDEALAYIQQDSAQIKLELKELQTKVEALENVPEEERDVEALEELREKLKILEIQSEANLPDVRWKAWNAMGDMNKLIYRHLLEQRWREDGVLDLLMERIHQMNVVPDLLPSLHPTLDLRLNFPDVPKSGWTRHRAKRQYKKVEPGVFLLPEQTWRQPVLYTTVFHTDTRLYTLLMVDLDVPDTESQSYQAYLHWMQPNIALSALSPSPIPLTTSHTRYIPPHPQQGTPYHRYVVLLLPQESPTERISIPAPSDEERLGFNFRAFAEKYGLDGNRGGGAHMWREVWDNTVSRFYKDILKTEEPRYGRIPMEDPYVEVKKSKKYL